ncbi:MAG TPA: PQQ-binding-like beta-propeller repeat protein [Vicinamibacterales bacterium]|nr:PQQ-binding-like beta-propeller repeat protein [Vicinamibacterales bacterium]
MSTRSLTFVMASACALWATVSLRSAVDPKPGVDWPSFRGIRGAGVADGFKTPTTWNVPNNQGVRWKTPIEGLGHASPIIWGNRVCVTTAISGKPDAGLKIGLYGDIASVPDDTVHVWKLTCLDKKSGKVLVDRQIHSGVPVIKRHLKSTHANATLATDGTHLVAMLGSEGLHTFDLNGKLLWKNDLGVLDSGFYMVPAAQWEFSSSPVIHEGVIIIQADVQKNSFLAAFDVKTGKELWRTPRQDVPTFSTPTVHQVGGRTQILVNGWKHMGAYDFKTGQEIWKLGGGGDIPVPTPVAGHGLIYITNSHGGRSPIFAIRETATGALALGATETSNTHIAWSLPSDGAYMITPVLYGDLLYVAKNNGVIVALDAKTGERVYQPQRLAAATTPFTASVVAADGKLYFTSEEGDVYVVKAGRTFELLATNALGDIAMATPAISEGVIYFRTAKSLIAVQ